MVGENNPFNIKFSKRNHWFGQTGSKRGFCEFDTLEHGVRACYLLLCNYIRSNYDSIERIINRFAPETENNSLAYISFVCKYTVYGNHNLGAKPVKALDQLNPKDRIFTYRNLFRLMSSMAWFETHTALSSEDIIRLLDFRKDMLNSRISLL